MVPPVSAHKGRVCRGAVNRLPTGALVRGVVATTTIAASALSHVGWWLDWQTRGPAGQRWGTIDELAELLPAAVRRWPRQAPGHDHALPGRLQPPVIVDHG